MLVPVMAWDAVLFTHRLIGPLARFRGTIAHITRGEPVHLIKPCHRVRLDKLVGFIAEFTAFASVRAGQQPIAAGAY